MKYFKFLFVLVLMLCVNLCEAQDESAFGQTMRSSGRIYVVIAVLATILLGLILYMVRVEKKIGKMEKETI